MKKPYRVAYQGVPGAYSEMAATKACPDAEPVPCEQFEVAFQVTRGCERVEAREVGWKQSNAEIELFTCLTGGGGSSEQFVSQVTGGGWSRGGAARDGGREGSSSM